MLALTRGQGHGQPNTIPCCERGTMELAHRLQWTHDPTICLFQLRAGIKYTTVGCSSVVNEVNERASQNVALDKHNYQLCLCLRHGPAEWVHVEGGTQLSRANTINIYMCISIFTTTRPSPHMQHTATYSRWPSPICWSSPPRCRSSRSCTQWNRGRGAPPYARCPSSSRTYRPGCRCSR